VIGDRWGVTDAEISRAYPCDDFVACPALQAWRGVSVEAPARTVWPRVAQISPDVPEIHPKIVWAKFEALAEGARRATTRLR
jgi:hypothetical protein